MKKSIEPFCFNGDRIKKNGIRKQFFDDTVKTLQAKESIFKKGAIVDSAVVEATSSALLRDYSAFEDRCKGRQKQTAKLNMPFALANLYFAYRPSVTV